VNALIFMLAVVAFSVLVMGVKATVLVLLGSAVAMIVLGAAFFAWGTFLDWVMR
jgi:hypothetical protein